MLPDATKDYVSTHATRAISWGSAAHTRAERQEELDSDLQYTGEELDSAVVAEDQIRTIIQTFRDKLFTEIFPGRKEVPKTIIFAKDDSHADDIVRIVRDEFGRGNDFCQKITYRTGTMRVTDKVTDWPRLTVPLERRGETEVA